MRTNVAANVYQIWSDILGLIEHSLTLAPNFTYNTDTCIFFKMLLVTCSKTITFSQKYENLSYTKLVGNFQQNVMQGQFV